MNDAIKNIVTKTGSSNNILSMFTKVIGTPLVLVYFPSVQ